MTGAERAVTGGFETVDGVEWYRIDHYDALEPFLVNVVTADDQWIFASSSGALTAGRHSADHAMFPYETDDRLHRSGGLTGPLTLIRPSGSPTAWQPFDPTAPFGSVTRTLHKTATGDRLRFSEHNGAIGLTFSYTWSSAGDLGLIRQSELAADQGAAAIGVAVLDGLVNVLPAGVELAAQQATSTLVDAYRRSELDETSGLALFTLEALVTDHADPAESLTATTMWTRGLDGATIALSDRQVGRFRSGDRVDDEHLVTGRKGAFLLSTVVTVEPDRPLRWIIGADVDQDHLAVARLRHRLLDDHDLIAEVDAAIGASSMELQAIVSEADGDQETAERETSVHHFANTLFNCMRGGVFLDDHRIDVAEAGRSIAQRNRPAGERFAPIAADLEPVVELEDLRAAVVGDQQLTRLVNEYLPLTFSRRHGDPSRPWNSFSIPRRGSDGRPAAGYEGNWRDIFQNWHALASSFPGYIESIVAKFLNASTVDGHNPYRITDRGIDWEVPEEGSWGNFGYWGDHQIVYLHRLLDAAERFQPGLLERRLNDACYSSADVPYRIRTFDELVADPKKTLIFDEERQAEVEARVDLIGADGRLVPADRSTDRPEVHLATMAEKLLVPAMAKLANLVPGAGIWLNTQRPEWNDANNALVGNGVSTVTLLHLRDYLGFVDDLLARVTGPLDVATPVVQWMTDQQQAFEDADAAIPVDTSGDAARRHLFDRLGRGFERYRSTVYDADPGPATPVDADRIRRFLAAAGPHLDNAASAARRDDGLVHSYWLVDLTDGEARLDPLYEMLEGQVAALGSPDCDGPTALRLVDTLYGSAMYRPDQRSFTLYPNRAVSPFVEKNRVPPASVGPAMIGLLDSGAGIVARDADGIVRFDAALVSERLLADAIDRLAASGDLGSSVEAARDEIEAAYRAVFDHHAFTGRSQTMYRYEGLGSIYWHMVSKLLIAVQERIVAAADQDEDNDEPDGQVLGELIDRYRRIRSGLGFMKTPGEQGSFPTDPHSHTPAHTGAQQPGMTGQVKEGVLARWGELGVDVRDGRVRFRPLLLERAEFLTEARPWSPLGGDEVLAAGTLGFTYCGTPVVYHLGDGEAWTAVTWNDGRTERSDGPGLDEETSRALFSRRGLIARIDVGVPADTLLARSR